jgi:hypothetical protein
MDLKHAIDIGSKAAETKTACTYMDELDLELIGLGPNLVATRTRQVHLEDATIRIQLS